MRCFPPSRLPASAECCYPTGTTNGLGRGVEVRVLLPLLFSCAREPTNIVLAQREMYAVIDQRGHRDVPICLLLQREYFLVCCMRHVVPSHLSCSCSSMREGRVCCSFSSSFFRSSVRCFGIHSTFISGQSTDRGTPPPVRLCGSRCTYLVMTESPPPGAGLLVLKKRMRIHMAAARHGQTCSGKGVAPVSLGGRLFLLSVSALCSLPVSVLLSPCPPTWRDC